MVDGKIEALDTPQRLKERFHAQDMDEVFRQIGTQGCKKLQKKIKEKRE